MKPAPICCVEIPAPNIEMAGSFYNSVFNWQITPSNLSDQQYWMFSAGDDSIAGGLDSTKKAQDGDLRLYIKVEDIESCINSIEKQGGQVIRGKFEIGGRYGFSAIFKDSNGNTLVLWANK